MINSLSFGVISNIFGGLVAQLCGSSHYSMKGIFKVQEEEEFNAWSAEKASELAGEDEEVW